MRPLFDWLGRGYSVAFAATLVAALLRHALDGVLSDTAPLLPFFGAVVVGAWAGGWWGGLLATALSIATVAWVFLPPRYEFALADPRYYLVLALFAVFGLVVAALSDALHRYRRQSQQRAAHLERALADRERAEEQLLVAIEAGAMGTWHVDYRTGTVTLSPQVGPMFGLPPGHTFPSVQAWLDVVHPDDRVELAQRIEAPDPDRPLGTTTIEYRARLPDGTLRWLSARGRPLHDENGERIGASGIVQDVTESRARREYLTALDEVLPQIVWACTPDAKMEFLNVRWQQYTGRLVAESLGDAWSASVHPDDLPAMRAAWRKGAGGRSAVESEYRLRGSDGTYRWFLGRGVPIRDAQGRLLRWYGTCTDIDRAKVTEQVLRDQEAELMAADRRKDVFLATLAHELRNPLAPVRYALKLLGPESPAETSARAREMIDRQLRHMTRLIDDLLDVSRITRGVMELKTGLLDLREVVDAAVQAVRPLADAEGHELVVAMSDTPLPVVGDTVRLSQVIGNLLNNAVKYTERGGRIVVRARLVGQSVEVSVRDTGIGIEPEMLPRVFELFSQVEKNSTRAKGGLGIGLSLARRIVELHDGRLEARSEGRGRGSEFTMRLPRAEVLPEAAQAPEQKVVPLFRGRLRVLVADDNADAAQSLAHLLEMSGYTVHVASDGLAAIEMADVLRPDVMLLDVGMPRMSGIDAAKWVRQQPWGAQPVLIAITGWGQADDRRGTREAGFDEHLTKPVDPDELLRRLAAIPRGGDSGARRATRS